MEGEGVVSLLEQIGISAAALLKEAQGGAPLHTIVGAPEDTRCIADVEQGNAA